MAALLQVNSVSKRFGAVQALRGVSFRVEPGEVHALLGENGAGKSTLVKLITGAHPPDEGTISMDGATHRRLSPITAHRLGIACIYQQPALFPDLTVMENLALRLEHPGVFRLISWKTRRMRALGLLARIGADIPPEALVRDLSMPEQQLVEIACALGAGARLLIMDEPTASLTTSEQEKLYGLIKELRSSGAGIVYISHRLEEIFQLADRVTVLRDGVSVATKQISEVTHRELIQLMIGREVSQLYPQANSDPGEPVLRLENLGCKVGGVHQVQLELRAGEILGLAGLVGAGRTELARVLFGITPADAGTVVLAGKPVRIGSPREAVRLGIAYVPEDRRRHGVIQLMSIAENTTLAIHPRLFHHAWLRTAAERTLALQFIHNLEIVAESPDAPCGSLSGGNQQKVALARWLAAEPRILILDEPTQGVDIGAKSEIHKLIRKLAVQGMAVLLISSDLPEILGMSDRIAVMRGGTVAGTLPRDSSPQEIMSIALGHTANPSGASLAQAHQP